MNAIFPIIKKELKSYFNSPIAYIFITIFLVMSSWLFFNTYFLEKQATMRGFFMFLPWIFLFLVPAVTMRLWAEEKRQGTLEVLMTLPVKDSDVVLGKFLASFIFLALCLLLTFPIALIVIFTGKPDIGVIFVQYLGSLLLGSAYLAIGLFVSSFTNNQIIAFVVAIALNFAFLIVGTDFVLFMVPDFAQALLQYLGLGTHFFNMGRGVIDSRDLVYYLSIIAVFLLLNARTIAGRKWK